MERNTKKNKKSKKNVKYVEISLYDLKKIMNLYSMKWNDEISKAQHGKLKEKEKNKSLAISFTGQEKKYLMNACLGSFSQKLDNQKRCDLKPNASFQSIDVSNMGLNQWQVVITSGNENKNKDVTVSKLIVTRNELSAKKELQYEIFRNNIKMKLDKEEKPANKKSSVFLKK